MRRNSGFKLTKLAIFLIVGALFGFLLIALWTPSQKPVKTRKNGPTTSGQVFPTLNVEELDETETVSIKAYQHIDQRQYYGLSLQDLVLNYHIFEDQKFGTFVDIGSGDPIKGSASFFFEKTLDWNGLCIEPNPSHHPFIRAQRKCTLIEDCWAVRDGNRRIMPFYNSPDTIDVTCQTLSAMLKKNGINYVNLLSIEIPEGQAELIQSLDFKDIQVEVISVLVYDNPTMIFIEHRLENVGFQLIAVVGRRHMLFASKTRFHIKFQKNEFDSLIQVDSEVPIKF